MTIVVGVAVPDGLILAADSRTTLLAGNRRARIGSDNAQKVFLLAGRFGVACYGAAFLEEKTISGAIREFEAGIRPGIQLEDLILELGAFFQKKALKSFRKLAGRTWRPADDWQLGLLVAGFTQENVGHLFEIRVPGQKGRAQVIAPNVSTTNIGLAPRGMVDVVDRLLAGFDPGALAASGVTPSKAMENALAGLEYEPILPITMQDAVDWAMLLIRTTIDMQRLSDGTRADAGGVPACGGPVRVLALEQNGHEWVSRPTLTATPPGNAEGSVVAC